MTPSNLNVLVISDLHAHDGDPSKSSSPSYFSSNGLYSDPSINPLKTIPNVIQEAGLKVDWIVSPGDLGDRADPGAQLAAWQELERIRQAVGAKNLIATVGNHDIDSRRGFPEFDPKSSLQQLLPSFPLDCDCYDKNDNVYVDRFWSRNFVVVPFQEFDCTLLIINSCAFHGYSSDVRKPPSEHLRGRISPLTLKAIKDSLKDRSTRLNLALVHHHLTKHPGIDDGDSLMNAGLLIGILKETGKQWLVIHGHQHTPFISYGDATALSPVILSAGSVSVKTHRTVGGHARNQFHHLQIDVSTMEKSGVELLGQVTSWSWKFESGWQKASSDGGISFSSGFGYRPNAIEVRDKITQAAQAKAPALLSWSEVVASHPRLKHIIAPDRQAIIKLLEANGVQVEIDQFDNPQRLEWRP
jgi:3',5'-cyclic AMP phosphodiesterase CpdA